MRGTSWGWSPIVRDKSFELVPRVPLATILTTLLVLILSWSSCTALWSRTSNAVGAVRYAAAMIIAVSAIMTVRTVRARPFGLAWACYWAWSFVFLGLAPAYQLATGLFPWLGQFEDSTIFRAQVIVLSGHIAVAVGRRLASRRSRQGRQTLLQAVQRSDRARPVVHILVGAQFAVSALFVALMGPTALISGRSGFRAQLLNVATVPGGGTLYFLATAAAITVPALAIACSKSGMLLNRSLLIVSVLSGFAVTNPFIGSRFLTGSFLVAVVGAQLIDRPAVRLLPVGMILLLVTIFPSLDLMRGDGTGAGRIQALSPSVALRTFDFDSFEMLARAVAVQGGSGSEVVNPAMIVIAPVLRWVPFLAPKVVGFVSGPLVARATGMTFTNVSMPLWAEGYLLAGLPGTIVLLGMLGVWLGVARGGSGLVDGRRLGSQVVDAPTGALLFIVLRGSLYEVLGYLLFTIVVRAVLFRFGRDVGVRLRALRSSVTPIKEVGDDARRE